jgi:hypothetical protein
MVEACTDRYIFGASPTPAALSPHMNVTIRIRATSGAVMAGMLALSGSRIAAQDNIPRPDRWAVGAELGLNAARGSSSYTMLTTGVRFTHVNKKQFELDWANAVTYGESNEKVIARRMMTTLKADVHPLATWSPFVFASAESDRIRRVDLATNEGAGVKWTFFRNVPGSVSVSLAGIHNYKSIVPAPTSTTPATESPRISTARLSLRPKIIQRHPSGVSFEQTTFWQPVVNGPEDYTVESSSRISYATSKNGTVFFQHTYRMESRPPIGVKRDDQLMVAGIKVQF